VEASAKQCPCGTFVPSAANYCFNCGNCLSKLSHGQRMPRACWDIICMMQPSDWEKVRQVLQEEYMRTVSRNGPCCRATRHRRCARCRHASPPDDTRLSEEEENLIDKVLGRYGD
jgi:hypothetical protein